VFVIGIEMGPSNGTLMFRTIDSIAGREVVAAARD
jgi:hypothetical protein